MTTEIADAIEKALGAGGVLVVVEAEHLCMSMRGVKKPGTSTVTSAVRGLFRSDPATSAEAMAVRPRSLSPPVDGPEAPSAAEGRFTLWPHAESPTLRLEPTLWSWACST